MPSTQRGLEEPFEIQVYEIDDVERLQRRRRGSSKVRLLVTYGRTAPPPNRQVLEHGPERCAQAHGAFPAGFWGGWESWLCASHGVCTGQGELCPACREGSTAGGAAGLGGSSGSSLEPQHLLHVRNARDRPTLRLSERTRAEGTNVAGRAQIPPNVPARGRLPRRRPRTEHPRLQEAACFRAGGLVSLSPRPPSLLICLLGGHKLQRETENSGASPAENYPAAGQVRVADEGAGGHQAVPDAGSQQVAQRV